MRLQGSKNNKETRLNEKQSHRCRDQLCSCLCAFFSFSDFLLLLFVLCVFLHLRFYIFSQKSDKKQDITKEYKKCSRLFTIDFMV
jgi:hypothetical protein